MTADWVGPLFVFVAVTIGALSVLMTVSYLFEGVASFLGAVSPAQAPAQGPRTLK